MSLVHLHLALNHVPVVGVLFAAALLLAGIVTRSEPLKRASLFTFVALALIALVVYFTGEPAEEVVEGLPGVSEAVVERHEALGKITIVAVELLGALALASLLLARRARGALATGLAGVVLAGSVIAGALLVATANQGGQIRHSEIRAASASPQAAWSERDHGRGHEDDD